MNNTRRGFLTGLTAIIASPAIVRASSLMPIKRWQHTDDNFNAYRTQMLISIAGATAVPIRFLGQPLQVQDIMTNEVLNLLYDKYDLSFKLVK